MCLRSNGGTGGGGELFLGDEGEGGWGQAGTSAGLNRAFSVMSRHVFGVDKGGVREFFQGNVMGESGDVWGQTDVPCQHRSVGPLTWVFCPMAVPDEAINIKELC